MNRHARSAQLCLSILFANALIAAFATPAVGEETEGITDAALSVLGFFGAMPHHANNRAFYDLGVSLPYGHQPSTTMFSGLPGVPDDIDLAGWGVRPQLTAQGTHVGVHVQFALDFGKEMDLGSGLRFDRSFGVNVSYHCGFNTLFFLGERSPVMLSVGPMLDVLMGYRYRLRQFQGGEVVGRAQWGRVGEIRVAPSATFAVTRGPILIHVLGAWLSGPTSLTIAGMTAGEATGTFAGADPDAPDLRPDNPDNVEAARASLQRVRATGGYYVSAGALFTPGREKEEHRLAIGFSVAHGERRYRVREGGFGLNSRFVESELRFMIGLGVVFRDGIMGE